MKDTTKTIIIGSVVTILVLILTIFILYKIDSKKEVKALNDNEPRENLNNLENNNTINTPVSSDNNNNNSTNNNENNTSIKDDEKNDKVILYMFHGITCPHCVNAIATIKEERNTTFKNIEIRTFEVWKNEDNSTLYEKVTDKLKVNVNSVPYFIIGEYNKVGFNADTLISEYKKALKNNNFKDIVEEVIKENPDLNPKYETI